MNQPEPMTYVPDWAYKTAEVKFLKIFKLSFYSEWRDNGEHKHFVNVSLFGKWQLVKIETRTGITKNGLNNYLPRIYKPKKFFGIYNRDLTDKYEYNVSKDNKRKIVALNVSDSEFKSEFMYSANDSSQFKI